MLTFSDKQFKTFGNRKAKTFYDELRADLHDFLARKRPDVEPDRADERITAAFYTCRDNGFKTEKQITRLSYILVTFPRDFAQRPKYQWLDGLLRAQVSADLRLDRIRACIKAGSEPNG